MGVQVGFGRVLSGSVGFARIWSGLGRVIAQFDVRFCEKVSGYVGLSLVRIPHQMWYQCPPTHLFIMVHGMVSARAS